MQTKMKINKNEFKNYRKDKYMAKYKLILYLILCNHELMYYEFLNIYRIKPYNSKVVILELHLKDNEKTI